MQKAVRGLLIAHELKITQKFPKIITINYQLPISALGWGKLIVCAASGGAALDSLTQLH